MLNSILVGKTIKNGRKHKSFTQKKLAEELKVHYTLISRWESGSSYPTISEISELERVLQIELIPLMFPGYTKTTESKISQMEKLLNLILFFCTGLGETKTKLNKLLFYSDFKHYKEHGTSITDSVYVHLPFGPVPDNFELSFQQILNDGFLGMKTMLNSGGYEIKKLVSQLDPYYPFLESEKIVMQQILAFFRNHSARAIKDFSHEEKGYKETKDGEMIHYDYAKYLQI